MKPAKGDSAVPENNSAAQSEGAASALEKAKLIAAKALWALAFFLAIGIAFFLLEVPSGLRWWQIVGGGSFLGIANVLSDKMGSLWKL